MRGEIFLVDAIGAAQRTAGLTVLTITAGATYPLEVKNTFLRSADNATPWQLRAHWQKITTMGTVVAAGTTVIRNKSPQGATAGFAAASDYTDEPDTYSAVIHDQYGAGVQPSTTGWKWTNYFDAAETIFVPVNGIYGLKVDTATFAGTIFHVTTEVLEIKQ